MGLRELTVGRCNTCRWEGRVADNGVMPEHFRKPFGAYQAISESQVRCPGSGQSPDYTNMYWEDFCVFIVQKGLPYTERDVRGIAETFATGICEVYGDGPEAEKAMEEVEKAIREDATKYNNPPRKS